MISSYISAYKSQILGEFSCSRHAWPKAFLSNFLQVLKMIKIRQVIIKSIMITIQDND